MIEHFRESLGGFLAGGYLAHLATIAGFLLALFLVARLMSERRAPANTFAWFLIIVLAPWVGVPLYLLVGGRKLRRLAERKVHLVPKLPNAMVAPLVEGCQAVARTVSSAGANPPLGGNTLRLLTTGEEDFAEWARLIGSARHTIHITTFILGRDDTGRRLVELLAARAAAGVKVRLLLDALGCLRTSGSFVAPLKRAGGEVGRFMPVLPIAFPGSANLRNHRKMAIFDHRTAIFGGRNMAEEYMGPMASDRRWTDIGARIDGPAALLLNEIFLADWCFATHQKPEDLHDEIPRDNPPDGGSAEVQVVASGPDVTGDPLYEGIVSMVQQAEHSIWIVTPYFIPDEVLQRSLIVKARAGCEVTLVVPRRSNHPVADYARRYYTRELRRAGGRVLLYDAGMNHAKAVIIDERVALLGSANFDIRSLFVNFEVGVFIYSQPEIRAIRAWAEAVMAHASAPPPAPDGRHLARSAVEELSRLLAPLL